MREWENWISHSEWLQYGAIYGIKFQFQGLQSKSSCKGSALYVALLWYLRVCFGYCEPLSPRRRGKPSGCFLIFHSSGGRPGMIALKMSAFLESGGSCIYSDGYPSVNKTMLSLCEAAKSRQGWNLGEVGLLWKILQIESRWTRSQINIRHKYVFKMCSVQTFSRSRICLTAP